MYASYRRPRATTGPERIAIAAACDILPCRIPVCCRLHQCVRRSRTVTDNNRTGVRRTARILAWRRILSGIGLNVLRCFHSHNAYCLGLLIRMIELTSYNIGLYVLRCFHSHNAFFSYSNA